MGLGTVFGALAFGFIFAGMVVFATVVQHNMATAASEQQDRQREQLLQSQSEITITGGDYVTDSVVTWTDTLYHDFEPGTFNDTELDHDGNIHISLGYLTGYYTSPIIDTGYSSNYTTISWTSIEPGGSSVDFQVRSGATQAALLAASFTGPNGSTVDRYTISGTTINETHNGSRYIQYQARLFSSPGLPEVQAVSIGIKRPVGRVSVSIDNTGRTSLKPDETDVYLNGVRIERNVTKRIITLNDQAEQALWNPGETLNVTVFTAATGGLFRVTASNNAATASTLVS